MSLSARLCRLERAFSPPVRSVRDLSDEELWAYLTLLERIREAEGAGKPKAEIEELRKELGRTLGPITGPAEDVARLRAMSDEELNAEFERLWNDCKRLEAEFGRGWL
jgi:hypothetical protein